MATLLGIDPGLGGALAWLRLDGTLEAVSDMPVLDGEVSTALLMTDERLACEAVTVAILEWPHTMPHDSARSARTFGMTLGSVTTFLAMRHIAVHRVSPGQWKKGLGLNADKERSRAMAIRLWPEHAESFKFKKNADRAEAALLAHWWLTKHPERSLVL